MSNKGLIIRSCEVELWWEEGVIVSDNAILAYYKRISWTFNIKAGLQWHLITWEI